MARHRKSEKEERETKKIFLATRAETSRRCRNLRRRGLHDAIEWKVRDEYSRAR